MSLSIPKTGPHGQHYTAGVQPIDLIESMELNFSEGNAIKYIARHRRKGTPVQDLEKALYYVNRLLEIAKQNATPKPA